MPLDARSSLWVALNALSDPATLDVLLDTFHAELPAQFDAAFLRPRLTQSKAYRAYLEMHARRGVELPPSLYITLAVDELREDVSAEADRFSALSFLWETKVPLPSTPLAYWEELMRRAVSSPIDREYPFLFDQLRSLVPMPDLRSLYQVLQAAYRSANGQLTSPQERACAQQLIKFLIQQGLELSDKEKAIVGL